LYKNKIFAIINGFGLSISMATSFIILLFVINEFSYNRFNKNHKRIYRVVNFYKDFGTTQAGTPYVLAWALKEDFPQVERAIRVKPFGEVKLKARDEYIPIYRTMTADPEIFDIFTFPLIMGSSNEHLLEDLNSLVISRDIAQKFFPDENPVGKEIMGMVNNEEHSFMITGVFENIPVNSTLRVQCFINSKWSLDPINKSFGITNADESWQHDFWTTWILLTKGSDAKDLETQFESFEKKYIGDQPHNHYSLQKLSDVYLKSDDVQNTGIKGNMNNVKLFSLIAALIILVAAINYIILSTALSTLRAKEIGIRKTFGAGNISIRNQMLTESILIVVLVLPVALILAWIALPYAGKLFQKELFIINLNIITYSSVYIIVTILIGLSAGLYTSTYLSKLKVLDVIKNTVYTGKRKSLLRSALIIVQLVIFCSFISSVLTIRSQYRYALNKDSGHNKQDILLINLGYGFPSYSAYVNEIRMNSNVINAAGVMEAIPMRGSMSSMVPNYEDQNIEVKVEGLAVDYGFIETMGLEVIKGRSFSEEFGSDLENSVLLNETAVKQLGIKDPVGKMMVGATIIGIVKDFNLHSIHSKIPALYISMTDKYIMQVAVHYKPGTLSTILPMFEAEWKKIAPDRPFRYNTIEDLFKDIYAGEKSLISIVTIAAIFTILIAVFGLFGLTLFITTTRTKEIGIKKVLGSSEQSILYSLLYENIALVIIATILSVPVTMYFMSRWLNNYPYKVNISWWIFLIAFVMAAFVVLLTVYYHTYKVSRTNPVIALRYE
jgi:putative ABC transport system permease protein